MRSTVLYIPAKGLKFRPERTSLFFMGLTCPISDEKICHSPHILISYISLPL